MTISTIQTRHTHFSINLNQKPVMKTAYFTFGQDHTHRLHNITLDKDIVIAITDEAPRAEAFALFGTKWSLQYDEQPDMKYFPRGVYHYPTEQG